MKTRKPQSLPRSLERVRQEANQTSLYLAEQMIKARRSPVLGARTAQNSKPHAGAGKPGRRFKESA